MTYNVSSGTLSLYTTYFMQRIPNRRLATARRPASNLCLIFDYVRVINFLLRLIIIIIIIIIIMF